MFHFIKMVALLLAFSSTAIKAQDVTLTVTGIALLKGNIIGGIYGADNNFPERGMSIQKQVRSADTNTITMVFTNIPDGEYAIAVFHDEDKSGKMNKNFIGIPQEMFGFSNKATPGALSPPEFEEAKFKVSGDTEHSIALTEW